MEDKDKLYRNLTILLKIFRNRPNHLAKYLIENEAFKEDFIKKILASDKLNKLNQDSVEEIFMDTFEEEYFATFEEMDAFYLDLLEKSSTRDTLKVEEEFNQKLKNHLQKEEYELAAKIRDYMIRNKINIKE